MNQEEVNAELYSKMTAEQKDFRDWLLGQPPGEILNHAAEYSAREDILMEMEYLDLPEQQAAALLKSPSPLADVYKDFQKAETNQMEVVRSCIEERAAKTLASQLEKTSTIPVYPHNGQHALENNELALFRASLKANIACKNAIENTIRESFDGMHLSTDGIKGLLEEFGAERVTHVLAATLQAKDYDNRFSRDNKEWAQSVPMFDTGKRHSDYLVESHPAVLDGFVKQFRKEMVQARETEKAEQRKPSIKEQLAVKPIQHEQPVKPKERGAR